MGSMQAVFLADEQETEEKYTPSSFSGNIGLFDYLCVS